MIPIGFLQGEIENGAELVLFGVLEDTFVERRPGFSDRVFRGLVLVEQLTPFAIDVVDGVAIPHRIGAVDGLRILFGRIRAVT